MPTEASRSIRFNPPTPNCLALIVLLLVPCSPLLGASFRVATYNLQNYFVDPHPTRPLKNHAAREAVQAQLLDLQADILALQEIGGTNALMELQEALHTKNLVYPHWELLTGWDTNIQIAVFSRFPIVARRPHTDQTFLLMGRKFRVGRGILEVDILVNPTYCLTLFSAHLKSRRTVPYADQSELRYKEALALRNLVDARLKANPGANIVVLGDFNDLKNSRPLRALRGRGKSALLDTQPAERFASTELLQRPAGSSDHHAINWTYYYDEEDTYSRIDYILISRGMEPEWLVSETYALRRPDWSQASDHRPIVASFVDRDR